MQRLPKPSAPVDWTRNVEPRVDLHRTHDEDHNKMADKARLGFGKAAIIGDGAVMAMQFGKWNDHALDPTGVRRIQDAFEREGRRWYEHPLPVLVKREWVDLSSLENTLQARDRLKEVVWSEAAKDQVIIACGGNHCMAALKETYQKLLKQQEVLRKKVEKGSGKKGTEKAQMTMDDLRHQHGKGEQLLAELPWWGLELLDLSKCQGDGTGIRAYQNTLQMRS